MHLYLLASEDDVETRAWKARVLTTQRGLADVNVSKNHVDRFVIWKLWEKGFEKIIYV